jgi:hypothetical protein
MFFLIFNFSSCFWNKEVVVRTEYKYVYPKICYRPAKPKLQKLNPKLGLTSSYNISILINNIIKMKTYSKLLESTVDCYENQIKESKNANSENNRTSK